MRKPPVSRRPRNGRWLSLARGYPSPRMNFKRKRPLLADGVLLSHGLHRSTIGARGLNFRVRDGTGCASPAMAAGQQGAFCLRSAPPPCPQGRTALESDPPSGLDRAHALPAPGKGERVRARTISTARLSTSPCLRLRPIEQVVYLCPYRKGRLISGRASRLDAFSGYPDRTQLPGHALGEQPVHRRSVHPGPLVLGAASLSLPAPTEDRDRTVSRRSEPSSRTALNGEQPYPWDLLQPQDAMSRHRGAKPSRRCGLLGKISLLSPEYLLSVERRPYHSVPPDH